MSADVLSDRIKALEEDRKMIERVNFRLREENVSLRRIVVAYLPVIKNDIQKVEAIIKNIFTEVSS